MSENCEQFWLECPIALFQNFDIVPEKSMCHNNKLNAATRLAVLVSVVLYFAEIKNWYIFLGLSIALIIALKYLFCNKSDKKEGYKTIQTLNPVWYHEQELDPIESIDTFCDNDYEMLDDGIVDDIEYIDTEYQPKRWFGVSRLMPDEEEQLEGLDRRQLQQLNTSKFADREVEARESIVHIFKKELQERFEPDEYYESY